MLDWQNILVALILLLAGLYLAKRGWDRIKAVRRGVPANGAGCHSGKCGGCGGE